MRWFDPISSRWIVTRDPPALDPVERFPKASPISPENERTWEALVASAVASCISGSRESDQCSESAKQ